MSTQSTAKITPPFIPLTPGRHKVVPPSEAVKTRLNIGSGILIRAAFAYGIRSIGSMTMGELHLAWWEAALSWIAFPADKLADVIFGASHQTFMSGRVVPSIIIGVIWVLFDRFLLDRGQKREGALRELARMFCAYALGTQILVYALVKMAASGWPAGLGHPTIASIYTTFGNASEGAFFWWWIGTAPTYRTFTAVVELCGALLMFNRRTATFGLLLNVMILVNIAVMMAGFDHMSIFNTIPASRFPFLIFLLWYDRRRIAAFFIRDVETVAPSHQHRWSRVWIRHALIALQIAYFTRTAFVDYEAMTFTTNRPRANTIRVSSATPGLMERLRLTLNQGNLYSTSVQHPLTRDFYRLPIEGLYQVERLSVGGAADSPTPANRWRHVVISRCRGVARTLSDSVQFFTVALRPGASSNSSFDCTSLDEYPRGHDVSSMGMSYGPTGASGPRDTLRYVVAEADRLELSGTYAGAQLMATLRRIPDERYPFYDPRWWRLK
jgi:hypothetical protein